MASPLDLLLLGPRIAGQLRHEMRPMIDKVDETSESIARLDEGFSEVSEPLRPAAERIGKLAERLPGRTKPDG